MAEGEDGAAGEQRLTLRHDFSRRAVMVERAVRPFPLGHRLACGVPYFEVWTDADALDLSTIEEGAVGTGIVQRELDAGGARVQDDDAAGLGHRVGLRRRYWRRRRHRRCRR